MAEEQEKEQVYLSLAVTFSEDPDDPDGSSGGLSGSMELDEIKNDGKTQFAPGGTAYFRAYIFPVDADLEPFQSTDGRASGPGAPVSRAINDEEITFTNSDSGNTSKPIVGGVSVRWLGTPISGAVSVTPSGSLKLSQKGTGVAKINYSTQYRPGSIQVNRITEDPYKVIVHTTAKPK